MALCGRCVFTTAARYIFGSNCTEKSALKYYQSWSGGIKVLLLADTIKRCGLRFCGLDMLKTLKKNLAGKILVEFPCIYFIYELQPSGFDIIYSDDDPITENVDKTDIAADTEKRQAAYAAQ